MRIFVAGATGAIGLPLVQALLQAGHSVLGMTQSNEGAQRLQREGCEAVIASALDPAAVASALQSARPEIVIDQLTSLPKDPADFAETRPRDTRLRLEGGGNLLRAAEAVGVRRYMQQSSGFFLKTDNELADEHAPFFLDASPGVAASAQTYADLEERLLSSSIEPVLLRYGFFYGPGTWYEPDGGYAGVVRQQKLPIIDQGQAVWSWVHIQDAVQATVSALESPTGVYNIVDSDPCPVSVWLPAFAASISAPTPPHMTAAEAEQTAGADAVFYGTKLVGATNAKARQVLNFIPRPLEWLPGSAETSARVPA